MTDKKPTTPVPIEPTEPDAFAVEVESRVPEHFFISNPEASALEFLDQLGESLDEHVYITGETLYLDRFDDGRKITPFLLLEKGTTLGRILWPAISALFPEREPEPVRG